MIPQETTTLDACIAKNDMPLEDLVPDEVARRQVDRWARLISQNDYFTPRHLKELNTYLAGELEVTRAERLSRFLIMALFNIGLDANHNGRIAERAHEFVTNPETFNRILGMESVKGLSLQPDVCRKIVAALRQFIHVVHDGELHFATEEDFVVGVQRWFEADRAAFYPRQKTRMDILREDLMAAAWHPKRVESWLEAGGFDTLDMMTGDKA